MLNLCWDLEAVAGRQSEAKDASTYGNIQREAVILQDDLIDSPQSWETRYVAVSQKEDDPG